MLGPLRLLEDLLDHAVLQAHPGDEDLLGAVQLRDPVVHEAGGEDDVGPVLPQPEPLHPALHRHAGELLHQPPEVPGLDAHGLRVVGVRLRAHVGDGGDGLDVPPRGDEQGGLLPVSAPRQLPAHQVHVFAQQLPRAPEVLLRGGEHVQQADRAEVVGVGQGDPAVLDEGDLHRAAAEVDDEGALLPEGDPLPDGEGDQPRLLVAVDHLDADAGGALEAAEQEVGVGRLPGGAGGDGPDGLHPVGLQELAEAPEGGLGLPDVLLPDGPLQEDVAPQADRLPEVLQDPVRGVPGRLHHVEPDRVGSHVDGGDAGHSRFPGSPTPAAPGAARPSP